MKTEKELYSAILKITMKIKLQFPELVNYILEMPVTILNVENPKMNSKVLQDYYDSLNVLLKDYVENHKVISKLV
jgi:hypothetical protein